MSTPTDTAAAPPMGARLGTQLSVMMFLQYAIWGAWLPLLWPFLNGHRGFSPSQIGDMFAVGAVGAIVAPWVAGQIADRWFNTEIYLGISHLLGAILVWQLATLEGYWSFLVFSLLYSIIYSPTLPLTNSLSFHHLPDRDRDFGRVRVWGTIGWIVVGITIGQWLLYNHTLSKSEANRRLIQQHILADDARENREDVVQIKLNDSEDTLQGTLYHASEEDDIYVFNIGSAEAPDLRAFWTLDVKSVTPSVKLLIRSERWPDAEKAFQDLDDQSQSPEQVQEALLAFADLKILTVKGDLSAAERGEEIVLQLKDGTTIAGKLRLKLDKLLVIEEEDSKLVAIMVENVDHLEAPVADSIVGTIEKDSGDEYVVKTRNGETREIAKDNVARVEDYGVFTSGTVSGLISSVQQAGMADAFRLSAILGAIMGVFCFFLPKTPPQPGQQASATTEAMQEIKRNPLLLLFLLAVPISCIHQFYFVHTAQFLGSHQLKIEGAAASINKIFGVGGGGLMTIGQMTEIAVLALMPFFAKRFSRKSLLAVGIVAYALRMLLFANVDSIEHLFGIPSVVTLILGVSLHGFCFGCFIFVAFMIVDEETTGDVRASAQSLFNLVIVGIGIIVGSKIAGVVAEWCTINGVIDYKALFSYPMWAAIACLVVLLLFYPRKKKTAEPAASV